MAGPRRALWARFTIALRRALAAALGIGGRDFPQHARLSYAKVAEYQRRGLVHFHAVIRLDGPDGPTDPPRPGSPTTPCAAPSPPPPAPPNHHRPAGRHSARAGLGYSARPPAGHLERGSSPRGRGGQITDAALAGYIAKYATKSTGAIHEETAARGPTNRSATASTSPTSTSPRTTAA